MMRNTWIIGVVVCVFIGAGVFFWTVSRKNTITSLLVTPTTLQTAGSRNMSMMFPIFPARRQSVSDVQWMLGAFQLRLDT